MYVDTAGRVTVGVGHLLTIDPYQKPVTMYHLNTNKVASMEDIRTEYCRMILERKDNVVASYYEKYASLVMRDKDIDALTSLHIESFAMELKVIFPGLMFSLSDAREYNIGINSENVQMALFDMIFNLGATKLRKGFPKFCMYIREGNFEMAAKECNRIGISKERNDYVRGLLWP